jgi:hypothetical protein
VSSRKAFCSFDEEGMFVFAIDLASLFLDIDPVLIL